MAIRAAGPDTHMVKAKVLAPVLVEFFGAPAAEKHLGLAHAV